MGSCFSRSNSSETNQIDASNQQTDRLHKCLHVTTEEDLNNIIKSNEDSKNLVVCEFFAVWCPSCSKIGPIIDEWSIRNDLSSVVFVKIDVDQSTNLSELHSVQVLPTFVFFKNGEEISRMSGADANNLQKEIDRFK